MGIVSRHPPYVYYANNPLKYTDLTGMWIDDWNINEKGVVKEIILTDRPHRLFVLGKNGNQTELSFNDPENDRAQLSTFKVGDQAVQFATEADINGIMQQSDINYKNIISRFYQARTESSAGSMDFGLAYLNSSPTRDMVDGFIVFGFENNEQAPYTKTAYNLMDGGNFLWGQAMKRLGFDYSSVKIGSEFNEWFQDSHADQRAIRSGFFYNIGTSRIDQSTYRRGFNPNR